MKKLALLLTVTLLLLVFAGCQLADMGRSMPAGQTTPTQTTPVTDAQDAALQLPQTQITKEEAQQIALKHAGYTAAAVKHLTVEFDEDDHFYEVEFTADGFEYNYEICAEYGTVLDVDKERDD